MNDRADAVRYARALEAALSGDTEVARAADDLAAVAAILAADRETMSVLLNPALSPANRKTLLDTIIASASLSEASAGFLRLMAERNHLRLLPLAAAALGRIKDRRMGIVEAVVTTASPLDPQQTEQVRTVLEKASGRKVRMTFRTDPAIIGGMVAKVGSEVFDGSVLKRLETMREQLTRG